MKRTAIKKVSKSSISSIQRKIWDECKRIIRARYLKRGCKKTWECYTCGASITGLNCHTGHMIAKASLGAYLKYDLRLLRPQCFKCNIHLGGMGAVFIENMRKREGDEYVDGILADRNILVKAIDHYIILLDKYKQIKK
jgi:ribosomal protein L37AE/L43A